jgi:hypothetical protein
MWIRFSGSIILNKGFVILNNGFGSGSFHNIVLAVKIFLLSKRSLNFYEILNLEFLVTYCSKGPDPDPLFGITGPDPGGQLITYFLDPEQCF